MRGWFSVLLLLGVLSLGGCWSDGLGEISGTVLIDGQPLDEGEMILEAVNRDVTPQATEIIDGKYSLKIAPGKKIVRINASRPTKIPDPVMGAAARESRIMPEFNVHSQLTIEVEAGRKAGVDFQVKEIP